MALISVLFLFFLGGLYFLRLWISMAMITEICIPYIWNLFERQAVKFMPNRTNPKGMYAFGFEDFNGHRWSMLYIDMEKMLNDK